MRGLSLRPPIPGTNPFYKMDPDRLPTLHVEAGWLHLQDQPTLYLQSPKHQHRKVTRLIKWALTKLIQVESCRKAKTDRHIPTVENQVIRGRLSVGSAN